jgi:NAD(P)-dependent dehydrogenase (short-subunit alcohol dehydrogenase family)
MGRMDGKVVLITGAGRGQGRSHAINLGREGAAVLALDCPRGMDVIPYGMAEPSDLEQTVAETEAAGGRIIAAEGDVRKQEDLDALVARGIAEFGHVNALIANAGVWSLGPFWEYSEELWGTVVDVILNGTWRSMKAVIPNMIEREDGAMVITSSVSGVEGGQGLAHYTAAKHGVLGLMKSAVLELGPQYGIRVNALLPGVVDTPIVKWKGALDYMAGAEDKGTVEMLEEGTKVWSALKGRGLLTTQSMTNAVMFLLSEDAADITGLEMLVDAGHRILPGLNQTVMAEQAEAASS